MKKRLCLSLISTGMLLTSFAYGSDKTLKTFEHQDLRVDFPEDGFAEQTVPQHPEAEYFSRYQVHLKFCRQPELPAHMQQVRSTDGWLCHFYVLPPLTVEQAKVEILKTQTSDQSISYQKQQGLIGEERFKQHPMLVWRHQSGKTRLDHFLVFGPEQNVLFVSSPYGDGDRIRKIVESLEFKK